MIHETRGMTMRATTRLLIAPLAFKGTLSARRAAAAMARGACAASSVRDGCSLTWALAPMADGGDGSIDALVASGWHRHRVVTRGAMGEAGWASFATSGSTAAVEIANACGLARHGSRHLDPLASTSTGLGDALVAALESRPTRLIVFLGGSASTDGGLGMLIALGAVKTSDRIDLAPALERLDGIDLVVASDVTSPMLGPHGAAAVFAPQKGASPTQVVALESRLEQLSAQLTASTGTDVAHAAGAGAAGGVGAALLALGARRALGAEVIANALRIDERLGSCDLLLTGEGSLDAQSTLGKGAWDLVGRAHERGIAAMVVAGQVALPSAELRQHGVVDYASLVSLAGEDAFTRPAWAIEQATATLVGRWLDDATASG